MPWLLHFLWNGRRDKVLEIARGLARLVGDSDEQHLSLARGTPAERFIQHGFYTTIYQNRAAFKKDAFGFALRKAHGAEWEEWDRAALCDYDPELSEKYTFAVAMKDNILITSPGRYVAALAGHFEREGGAFLQGEVGRHHPDRGRTRSGFAGRWRPTRGRTEWCWPPGFGRGDWQASWGIMRRWSPSAAIT